MLLTFILTCQLCICTPSFLITLMLGLVTVTTTDMQLMNGALKLVMLMGRGKVNYHSAHWVLLKLEVHQWLFPPGTCFHHWHTRFSQCWLSRNCGRGYRPMLVCGKWTSCSLRVTGKAQGKSPERWSPPDGQHCPGILQAQSKLVLEQNNLPRTGHTC